METLPRRSGPFEIVFSYTRRDKALRDELEKYLGPLKRRKRMVCWHDRHSRAGHTWSLEVTHFDTADIILLVSVGYCNTDKVGRVLQRHARSEVCAISVILRPADWAGETFARLLALSYDALPVVEWSSRDAAFYSIARNLRKVIAKIEGT